ncbi:MAG: glyoxalase/bleomycin resistance/dioxygenase family protein [Candidatus Lokiarchaeota archaeon]|nr:glyoxalase/bleomycin resistance/dioxygenase family protein [Candidatus Lokiarchaeota archaeon]
MTLVKFSMPVIFVKDISVSKQFYQDVLALEIENDFGENIIFKNAFSIWQEKRAEEIIFGSFKNEIVKEKKNLELYFESSDIETINKRIKAKNIEIIHDLKEEPWGQRTLRFYDPDKFIIEIAEPLDAVIIRLHKMKVPIKEIAKKTQMKLEYIKIVINKD